MGNQFRIVRGFSVSLIGMESGSTQACRHQLSLITRLAQRCARHHQPRYPGNALCSQVYVPQDINLTISRARLCPVFAFWLDLLWVLGIGTGHKTFFLAGTSA